MIRICPKTVKKWTGGGKQRGQLEGR